MFVGKLGLDVAKGFVGITVSRQYLGCFSFFKNDGFWASTQWLFFFVEMIEFILD